MSKHMDQIRRITSHIDKTVLPVGHTVRTKTTLGASPADMRMIRHHAEELDAENIRLRVQVARLQDAVRYGMVRPLHDYDGFEAGDLASLEDA